MAPKSTFGFRGMKAKRMKALPTMILSQILLKPAENFADVVCLGETRAS